MSPISSIPAAFALSTATPSIPADPDLAGQSASTMSQYLVGTGGILFAVVAIVSVAGYFHHGRKKTSNAQKNSTRATFSKFLSSMRHRESSTATAETGADWPSDVESGPEHVSMVYARAIHPTSWNLVESHPATSSAPPTHVEGEAKETLASGPKSFCMGSSLIMDHGDRDRNKDGSAKDAWANAGQGGKPRVPKVPSYDTSSATNAHFRSEIIGMADRPGGVFFSVPREYPDCSSEISSSHNAFQTFYGSKIDLSCPSRDGIVDKSEINFNCSPYDGIFTTPRRTYGDAFETLPDSKTDLVYSPYDGSLTDTELPYYRNLTDSQEFMCSPYGGIETTSPRSPEHSYETTPDSEPDFSCRLCDRLAAGDRPDISDLPYDGILKTPSPSTRRYGMADMADLAQTLKDNIPEEARGLVRTVDRRSGSYDLADFEKTGSEMDSATSCKEVDRRDRLNNKPMSAGCDIGIHDSRLRQSWRYSDLFGPLYDCRYLLETMLRELGHPDMDGIPRTLSVDSDPEHNDDDDGVSRFTPTWGVDSLSQVSPEWTSSISDRGSICPVAPLHRTAKSQPSSPGVYKACMTSPVTPRSVEEVQVAMPPCSCSPRWFPSKVNAQTHRSSRPLRMVCDSQAQMSTMPQVCAPGTYLARLESPVTWLNEEVQAICSASLPRLSSNPHVRRHMPRHPLQMVSRPTYWGLDRHHKHPRQ